MTNKYADLVKEFNETFGSSVSYEKLIREEFNEWWTETEEGTPELELKELCDLLYVVYGKAYTKGAGWDIHKNPEELKKMRNSYKEIMKSHPEVDMPKCSIATAYIHFIIDANDYMWLYRLAQSIFLYAELKKWPLEQAFNRVHKSNMSKLTKEGKVLRREDGKVLKSDQYKPPVLKDLVKATKKPDKVLRLKKKAS